MKWIEEKSGLLHGMLFIALFACAAFYLGNMNWVRILSISPMVVGIVLGMLYANTLRAHLPESWTPGIVFCSKKILRFGIILYGFRLCFQDVAAVGIPAIVVDALVVLVTIVLGTSIGRWMKMDWETALLTSCGSAICGAAAVMGVDGAIHPKAYKTAVAVATVVIFGTLSMFLYPVLFHIGVFNLNEVQMGLFTGSTIHEVAHVVGAGNAMGSVVSDGAIIVKMIRVMMLVPVLLVIAFLEAKKERSASAKVTIPWFAIFFLVVIAFNSLQLLPEGLVHFINTFDTFLLTMAMVALGVETSVDKFKKAGIKPFLLAFVLWTWLMAGGYCLAKYLVPSLM